MNPAFWRGKRVFVTGHTGFKGGWICLWLQSLGAVVKGFALEPATKPALFRVARVADGMESEYGDIRDAAVLERSIRAFRPDIVFHMAAQPLVLYSYEAPVESYATNVMGTVHLLEACRRSDTVRCIVNITTDKCYENREWVWGYREDERLGGHDPYSSSKACAEMVTSAYRRSFFTERGIAVASVRAGNVIGGGDWAENRLIPDLLRALEANRTASVRNPSSVRPWQHVLEPLAGYLALAERLWGGGQEFAEGWNFGPRESDARTVGWIAEQMVGIWGEGARWEVVSQVQPHEAHYLKLDCSKAHARLGWEPQWGLEQALERIVKWHRAYLQKADMRSYCLSEINDYMAALEGRG